MKKMETPPGHDVFIIAEAGTSHGGDIVKAKDLISAAADAGADCVKFQAVFADEIIHPQTGNVPLPGGNIPLYEVFKTLEREPDFYAALKTETEKRGLVFLCTPFGIRSARLLHDVGVTILKIASPELNHVPLLREIASYKLPVILSTGVSTMEDIIFALSFFSSEARHLAALYHSVMLLHCVTAYPAPEEEYNLKVIPNLSARFNIPVGLSDHSIDPILVPSAAAALGACAVEKHLCLSRGGSGVDDPIALEPLEFGRMVKEVRRFEKLYKTENTVECLKNLQETYGSKRIETIIGNGTKGLAPSEAGNYTRSNRSIHAVVDLTPGTELSETNIAVLRTEKVLKPGLHPKWFDTVLGRKVKRAVSSGEGISWEDLT